MESTPKEDMRSAQGVSALMISPVGTKLESILSTHPKTEKRIEKLNEMS
jgi:Zn-dependent protease with chaperone function